LDPGGALGCPGQHAPRSLDNVDSLRIAIAVIWLVFWAYWLVAALSAKKGAGSRRRLRSSSVGVIGLVVLLRALRGNGVAVHSTALEAIGAVLIVAGLAVRGLGADRVGP
jgi:hypothetical protein